MTTPEPEPRDKVARTHTVTTELSTEAAMLTTVTTTVPYVAYEELHFAWTVLQQTLVADRGSASEAIQALEGVITHLAADRERLSSEVAHMECRNKSLADAYDEVQVDQARLAQLEEVVVVLNAFIAAQPANPAPPVPQPAPRPTQPPPPTRRRRA